MTAPTGKTSQCPASRPSRQTCSTTPAVSATGSVLAIAWTAVKPPERGGAGAGLDGLGVLAARLAQVGVQVDQAGQHDQARRRRSPRRRSERAGARRQHAAITPSSSSRSAGVAAEDPGVA